MNPVYKVGIYCRLSVDDASRASKAKNYIPGDESVSIENQETICQGEILRFVTWIF